MTADERTRALKYLGIKSTDNSDDDIILLLDEAVYECKGHEAADINNSGVDSQLEYLGA